MDETVSQGDTGEEMEAKDPPCFTEETSGGEDEDGKVEGNSQARPTTLLWEKFIQQSIFVDISNGESLYFSGMQDSFIQDSPLDSSINLSENIEPSNFNKDVQHCSSFSREKKLMWDCESKGSVTGGSLPRSYLMERPQVQRCSEPGNTSDEDQEDLPYDGDLVVTDADVTTDRQNFVFPHVTSTRPCLEEELVHQNAQIICDVNSENNNGRSVVSTIGDEVNEIQNLVPRDKRSNESMDHGHTEETGPVNNRTDNKASNSDITNLLLRHLSQEELFSSSKYIEAETLPEVSFIDSVEETVLTKLPHSPRGSPDFCTTLKTTLCAHQDSKLSQMGNPPLLQSEHPKKYESQRNECGPESEMVEVSGEQPEVRHRFSSPKLIDGNMHIPRARPNHELKYGQGQVHYPLPDFSKVLPKVKIPKGSDTGRPDSKLPAALQGQPSPRFLRKSSKATIEVISQVLEDSIQLPEMAIVCSNQKKCHRDPLKTPETVQHLQAEYDQLLSRYTEAESLFDQMRLDSKAQDETQDDSSVPSEYVPLHQMNASGRSVDQPGSSLGHTHTHQTEYPHGLKEFVNLQAHPIKMDQNPSEGEKMTTEFEDIISQFWQKLQEFKVCLSCMSTSISDQQMIFKTLMDAKDQLERRYIGKKEEHRALEMQNYLGLAKNTGNFDPERQVEGEIFRIGMILEDIKEQIDKNAHSWLSPATSSSSPSPLLLVDPITPPLYSFPEKCQSPDKAEASLVCGASGPSESRPPIHADSLKHCASHSLQSSQKSKAALCQDPAENAPKTGVMKADGVSHLTQATLQIIAGPEKDSMMENLGPCPTTTDLFQSQVELSAEVCAGIPCFDTSGLNSKASWSNVQSGLSRRSSSRSTAGCWTHSTSVLSAEFEDTDSHTSGQPIAHRGGGHLVMALGDDRRPMDKATAEAHPHTCTCHNEAISALQSKVARLKKDLEKSLQYLPYITKRMNCLASKCKVKKRQRTKPRAYSKPASCSCWENERCRRKVVENCSSEDWITSSMKSISGSTEDPDLSTSQHDVLAEAREKDTTSHRGYPYCDEQGSSLAKKHLFAAHSSIHLKGKKLPLTRSIYFSTKTVSQLDQKDWRSSWSLPAGITAIEDQQRCSVQSDSAILPRNQLFKKKQHPPHTASKARSHRRSREKNEEVSRTLDMAIEAAWSMKQTTERMARNLSVDLAKVELYQKLHGLDPHGSGTNASC